MCGIAGIINFVEPNIDCAETVRKMTVALQHRGPDASGFFSEKNVYIGHRRLSIIDLSESAQPMDNEDGSVRIVFNGEIYNYPELREEMLECGHDFRSSGDTETIVHLYEEYGDKCIEKLNGMFALAIYDLKKRKIILARDRMGQKPLFYFCNQKRFVFASELQGLKQHPSMPRDLDFQAIHDYLSLQYIPDPKTIYREVHKLLPGHILTVDADTGSHVTRRYWNPDYVKKCDLSFADACVQLRELVEDAVAKRLMSDVPLGAFLSGGLDSTIIASLTAKLTDQPINTFSIGFDNPLYDEREYARMAVANIESCGFGKVNHHEKVVEPENFEIVKTLINHYGEPFADSSMLPTYLLSEFTRENVTVALSGDGADELFAGYERYLAYRWCSNLDRIPKALRSTAGFLANVMLSKGAGERTKRGRLRRFIDIMNTDPDGRYLHITNRFSEDVKGIMFGDVMQEFKPLPTARLFSQLELSAENKVERVMETDLKLYLPGDILTKVDIASMACSLEVRNPFLDYRIVEFAASLPLEYKQHGCSRKHILKEAFKDILPPEISSRAKKGFGVPVGAWFRGPWHALLREYLGRGVLTSGGLFSRDAVLWMIREHAEGIRDWSYPLWSLLMLELFLRKENQ
jgi:asparagine synthase (glutamine-hydrolysing)